MDTSVVSGPQRKLALVIGISNYDNGTNLPNAINDAKAISSALKDIGFILHEGGPKLNPTCKEMRHALIDFVDTIKTGDMVLFYYAGHGTQWEDRNYLIPSDNFKEEIRGNVTEKFKLSGSDLKKRAINVQNLLNDINDQDPFVTMFFLDCCRTYHLRDQQKSRGEQINHSQGLRPMPAKVGSLIAFACAPGTVADDGKAGETNGLFTKHLLKHIISPNDDIRMILSDVTNGVIQESKSKQIPHVTSILTHRNICLYNRISDSNRSDHPATSASAVLKNATISSQPRTKSQPHPKANVSQLPQSKFLPDVPERKPKSPKREPSTSESLKRELPKLESPKRESSIPESSKRQSSKPKLPKLELQEFAAPGTCKELHCEGRPCAKCHECRDWHFTGDQDQWDWVCNHKNWEDADWSRWGDYKKLFTRRHNGVTCCDRVPSLSHLCICEKH
ncbi:unnamed protein product [Adineta steineri]|uniref:Peptidase C14 caspase domain-containing protein n=1 Tax=Adineta steineri TaxID=433720 RepID=A0A814KYM8_9BILA|nr:unnamed protein product [Adineta steineri]CAF3954304.1 unnamed protein product [Adineta steineri]